MLIRDTLSKVHRSPETARKTVFFSGEVPPSEIPTPTPAPLPHRNSRVIPANASRAAVPTKVLVRQQAHYVSRLISERVVGLSGATFMDENSQLNELKQGTHIDRWSEQAWDATLRSAGVVVLTPKILVNALQW